MKAKVAGVFVLVATLIALYGGGGSCAWPDCFPDATNTGVPAGTSLTAYSGENPITTDNTVIDGKIVGCLSVQADGVIIRNSTISCTDASAVACFPEEGCGTTTELLIEDSEIDCTGYGASGIVGEGTGIFGDNFTARRVDVFGCENGLSISQNVLLVDSYIHDLYNDPVVPAPDGAHADGVQFASDHWNGTSYSPGAKDITLLHNTIFGAGWPNDESDCTVPPCGAGGESIGTSSIITNRGPTNIDENILVEKNLLGGGGVGIYCEQDGYAAINEQVIDNHFTTQFLPFDDPPYISGDCADEADTSGNVIHETGDTVVLD